MSGYSVRLPLTYDSGDGPYYLNKSIVDVVKQNLKMLILTNPGERVMNPEYGVGAKKLLFENRTPQELGRIQSEIAKQVGIYLPFIVLESVIIETADNTPDLNENAVGLTITYEIPNLNQTDTLNLILKAN